MSKKTTICPGCGKREEKEDIYFNIEVLEGETKENLYKTINKSVEIDGIKWCNVCR